MLRRLRVQAPSIASAVLLSMLMATASQALSAHNAADHDVACDSPSALRHDESAHRVGSAQTGNSPHPLHCLVCHWARAFRPLSSTWTHHPPILEPRASILFDSLPSPVTLAQAQLTLRSPPAGPFVL